MVARAPGLDNRGAGPSRFCAYCRWRVRAVGGDAVVMAEQATSGFAGLLRQLRAGAQLTQQELAKAAGVSPRSVSDLERGFTRTAHKDTGVLLAGALGLPGPVRELFVAAARGKAPAAQVVAALQEAVAGALGVLSATLLPVWAVASPVSVASLAFTEIASVPGAGTRMRADCLAG